MADLDGKILARLGATRLALTEAVGQHHHGHISKLQAGALQSLFRDATLDADQRAAIGSMVLKMQWAVPADMHAVLDSLASHAAPAPPPKRARRNCQNYAALSNYFPETLWEFLTSNAPYSAKLQEILTFAFKLGLRLPTEPCTKWLTSLWLVLCEPPAGLQRMTELDKHLQYNHVKSTLHAQRARLVDPPSWLEKLPDSPWELQKDHRQLWHDALGDAVPGVVPIDMKTVVTLDMSYACRGGRPAAPAQVRPMAGGIPFKVTSAHAAGAGNTGGDALERMASMFMDRMESFANSQSRVFELMLGHQRAVQPKASGAFQSLLDQRQPQISFSPRRRLALTGFDSGSPIAADDRALVAAVADRRSEADEIGSPGSLGSQVATAIVPVSPVTGTPGSVLADILNMVDERKAERKAAAKAAAVAAKKAAAVVCPEPAVAPGVATGTKAPAQPANVAKKALAKLEVEKPAAAKKAATKAAKKKKKAATKAAKAAVAKAAVVAEKAASKGAVAKAAVVAEKAASKVAVAKAADVAGKVASKAVVAKAAAVAKRAVAKAAAVAEVAAATGEDACGPLILGCAKCRHSVRGCGQCRSPAFGGHRWNPSVGVEG